MRRAPFVFTAPSLPPDPMIGSKHTLSDIISQPVSEGGHFSVPIRGHYCTPIDTSFGFGSGGCGGLGELCGVCGGDDAPDLPVRFVVVVEIGVVGEPAHAAA